MIMCKSYMHSLQPINLIAFLAGKKNYCVKTKICGLRLYTTSKKAYEILKSCDVLRFREGFMMRFQHDFNISCGISRFL